MWGKRIALLLLVAAALIRLSLYVRQFSRESLQMDFAAFYTAGESVAAGLSPYENYVTNEPPLWDGVTRDVYSRFYYPPLTATLFAPLAAVSYGQAKIIWMAVSIACIALAMGITWRHLRLPARPEQVLVVSLLVLLFFPLITLLERGQIDAVTLLLLAASIPLLDGGKGGQFFAGFLLAAATLLKPYSVVFVPFLLLRRRWAALAGYAASGLLFLVLSLIANGPQMLLEYALVHLPRISSFGGPGMLFEPAPAERFEQLLAGLPAGYTFKQEIVYRLSTLEFHENAAPARMLQESLARGGIQVALSTLSLGLLALLIVLIWFVQRRYGPIQPYAYWQIVMVTILLSAPLTWSMNLVWLLPLLLLYWSWYRGLRDRPSVLDRNTKVFFLLGLAGLLLAFLPDLLAGRAIGSPLAWLLSQKYVAAEWMIFASLLYLGLKLPVGDVAQGA
jgi:hypothetical protein